VRGTLWLDRRTIALQQIEYNYVMGQSERFSMEGGGAMDYIQLETGVWLASGWRTHLLMRPLTGAWRDERFMLHEGSDVVHAFTSDSVTFWKPTGQKVSTQNAVDADSLMDAAAGAPRLPVHSPGAAVIQGCGFSPSRDRTVEAVVLVGNLEGTPRANVPVRIDWLEAGGKLGRAAGETNSNGLFVACGIPPDQSVSLSVGKPDTNSRVVTLQTRRGVILTRSFLMN
jgi:hypothetical protein